MASRSSADPQSRAAPKLGLATLFAPQGSQPEQTETEQGNCRATIGNTVFDPLRNDPRGFKNSAGKNSREVSKFLRMRPAPELRSAISVEQGET